MQTADEYEHVCTDCVLTSVYSQIKQNVDLRRGRANRVGGVGAHVKCSQSVKIVSR